MQAISIQHVSKSYQGVQALTDVSLEIPQGEFFGLLGPNGAGKTTLIKLIVGLAKLERGTIHVLGMNHLQNARDLKKVIGLSAQEPNIDRFFNIRKILELQGGYFGLDRLERKARAEKLLEQFELGHKAKFAYWKLSGGMQRRLMLARAMMGAPKILILDEPTAGVDVEQRHRLWSFLKDLNKDGTTIILTTHYIDEAEILCERVGIIDGGRVVETGTPKTLIQKYCRSYLEVDGKKYETWGGVSVDHLTVYKGSLEEVFLKLTGQSIHEHQD